LLLVNGGQGAAEEPESPAIQSSCGGLANSDTGLIATINTRLPVEKDTVVTNEEVFETDFTQFLHELEKTFDNSSLLIPAKSFLDIVLAEKEPLLDDEIVSGAESFQTAPTPQAHSDHLDIALVLAISRHRFAMREVSSRYPRQAMWMR